MVHREYGGSHIEVFITFESKAIKTVDGSEVLIDGLLGVEVLSKSGSVEVTDVTVDMIAGKNVWLGDLLPDGYMGVEYFRAAEGPCVVQSSCYNADANREAYMEALLQRHNWGGKLVFYTWPDFSVDGDPPNYTGRITFRVMVEYLVRKGAFTAEKMKTVIEIPGRAGIQRNETRSVATLCPPSSPAPSRRGTAPSEGTRRTSGLSACRCSSRGRP